MLCATFGSIMMNILYIFIAIIVLLTMVLIHELGHYIAGRCLGFKINEFSIGFGKAIWQKTNKRGEKISFRIFPLGGFCAFDGEDEDDDGSESKKDDVVEVSASESDEKNNDTKVKVSDLKPLDENSLKVQTDNNKKELSASEEQERKAKAEADEKAGKFNAQKPWKRIIVYFAGVTFNFISAFIFALVFLCVGGYDGYLISPTEGFNVQYYGVESSIVLGNLEENTIVYAINGTEINYARTHVFNNLVAADAEVIVMTIDINGTKTDVKLLRDFTDEDGNKVFGINYTSYRIDYNFGDALRDFVPFTFNICGMILSAFWQILTGQIAFNQLGGPISTISQMTVVASYGVANFLYLLPLLAANLAIFNILPIPGLDGAHVIFTTIEWIRGKPIKRNVENAIHGWGIILLFAFVIIIDVIHLITV